MPTFYCPLVNPTTEHDMNCRKPLFLLVLMGMIFLAGHSPVMAQDLPTRYPTLELFTNTPCPICGSQNPGFFNRLANYEGEYHLISFYPGKPYSSCIFYQANISENTTRFQHYTGDVFGSPTVAINGIDFKSPNQVTTAVLDGLTGGTSWLHVDVEETTGTTRDVNIVLTDHAGGALASGRLFAVIVEREILYNAPNGETVHHNVFRRFLTAPAGEAVDLTSGSVSRTYQYTVEGTWNANETYVIAWLSDPSTEEIYNSGTRFDPDFVSSVRPVRSLGALQVYPNPASADVYVTLPDHLVRADVRIYDSAGRCVSTLEAAAGPNVRIDISGYPAGRYHVRLEDGKSVWGGSFQVIK